MVKKNVLLLAGLFLLNGCLLEESNPDSSKRSTACVQAFADAHWSFETYEWEAFRGNFAPWFASLNPNRLAFCSAVQDRGSPAGEALFAGCVSILTPDSVGNASWANFYATYNDQDTASRAVVRAQFSNPTQFYSLLGEQEFVGGWDDVQGHEYTQDSIAGTSAHRDAYLALRENGCAE